MSATTKRPTNAPGVEDPCELCGDAMGESWGVTRLDLDDAPIGELVQYLSIHPLCWWAENPDAVAKHNAQMREVNQEYELKRVEKEKKAKAASGRGRNR